MSSENTETSPSRRSAGASTDPTAPAAPPVLAASPAAAAVTASAACSSALKHALALVRAPSPSGHEGPALLAAETRLRAAGLSVMRQPVGGPERFNLFAARGTPRAVLSTHLDTVPGELPVHVRDGVLHGRGACDAKGAAGAMIAAAEQLVAQGVDDFGVLFVVGEETDSDGARAADALLAAGASTWRPEHALLAEPTDNRFVAAHPGVVVARVHASGREAHSSTPEQGHSALHALLDALQRVRAENWPRDELLGDTKLNIGRLVGGRAANVLAAHSEAELILRSGASAEQLAARLAELVERDCELELQCLSEPVRFELPPDAPAEVVPFSTDAPFLSALGRRWLCGPGSIHHAHSDDEQLAVSELLRAAALYVAWVRARLASARA